MIDREALLAALVLAPATWSRNRFFDLYKDPDARRVHRRAALLRGVVRHLARIDPATPGENVQVEPRADGRCALGYVVSTIGLRRTVTLDPIELSLLRFATGRIRGSESPLPASELDRRAIEAALARLAPPLRPAQADPPAS